MINHHNVKNININYVMNINVSITKTDLNTLDEFLRVA